MFTGSYFAKTYFAGSYWLPIDGTITILPSGGEIYRVVMRVRRGR